MQINGVSFGLTPIHLPAAQLQTLLRPGEFIVNEKNQSGPAAGIRFMPDGTLVLTEAGNYSIFNTADAKRAAHTADDRKTIRTAQFVCGITGLIIINLILLYDVAGRGSNIKDFLVNFSSDITALGAVLIIAEIVDKRMVSTRTAAAQQALQQASREFVANQAGRGNLSKGSGNAPRLEEEDERSHLFAEPIKTFA